MKAVEVLTLRGSTNPSADLSQGPVGNLTRGHFPRLHTLRLQHVYFPWSSTIYSSLRELELSLPQTPPSASSLFEILHACPDLERLVIDFRNYSLFTACGRVNQLSPVPLLKLAFLRIQIVFHNADFLCSRLTVPPSCVIHVTYPSNPRRNNLLPLMAPCQAVFLPAMGSCTRLDMVMDEYQEDDEQYLRLSASPGNPPPAHGHSVSLLPGSIFIDMFSHLIGDVDITPEGWTTVLSSFLAARPGQISPVKSFSLIYNLLPQISALMWREMMTAFPLLDNLAVGPLSCSTGPGSQLFATVFDALNDHRDFDDLQGNSTQLCGQHIHIIELIRIHIDAAAVDDLVHILERRAVAGAPLQELIFKDSVCVEGQVQPDEVKARLGSHTQVTILYVIPYCAP